MLSFSLATTPAFLSDRREHSGSPTGERKLPIVPCWNLSKTREIKIKIKMQTAYPPPVDIHSNIEQKMNVASDSEMNQALKRTFCPPVPPKEEVTHIGNKVVFY